MVRKAFYLKRNYSLRYKREKQKPFGVVNSFIETGMNFNENLFRLEFRYLLQHFFFASFHSGQYR